METQIDVQYLTSTYEKLLFGSDMRHKSESSSLLMFPLLSIPDTYEVPSYLNLFSSLKIMRSLVQFRLQNKYVRTILINNEITSFKPSEPCYNCDYEARDDPTHVIYFCPIFNDIRRNFIPTLDHDYTNFFWASIIDSNEKNIIFKFISMISAILKFRREMNV